MILCEFTPEGESMMRLAQNYYSADYQWLGLVKSFSSFRLSMDYDTGGYIQPQFTDFVLSPEVFTNISPIPRKATIKVVNTETTFAEGDLLFEGVAILMNDNRSSFSYTCRSEEFDTVVAEGQLLNGTLVAVMTWFCDAARLNLSIDTSAAASPSPAVYYTVPSDMLAIELASALCATFSHAFKIEDGTLYLMSVKTPTALTTPTHTLTEFDVKDATYTYNPPVSQFTAGDFALTGSDPSANNVRAESEVFHNVEANVLAYLGDVKDIIEAQNISVPAFIVGNDPKVGDIISFYDESGVHDTTTVAIVRSVVYNFDDYNMIIEGYGVRT
jgi:hypothetical protein